DRVGSRRRRPARRPSPARDGRGSRGRSRHPSARARRRQRLARGSLPRADVGVARMNALRAELLKAGTTRLLLWFGVGLVAFLVLVLSIHIGSQDPASLRELSTQRAAFGFAGLTAVIAILIGTILVT